MTSVGVHAESDDYLKRMKESRNNPAALKIRFVNLRSSIPDAPIFVYEGIDDKQVYYHWICKIRPELSYEPFVCSGKKYVLQLIEIIERDLNDLREGVYFFVDRDFDEIDGHPVIDNLFITEAYSIENYLVSECVVDELLKNDFHCHAEPEFRLGITELFTKSYDEFLTVTRDINYRLYLSRLLGIRHLKQLPTKISHFAKVSIDMTEGVGKEASEIVVVEREPVEQEEIQLKSIFDDFDPRLRYRGKFSYIFFSKWLQLLMDDRNGEDSKYFNGLDRRSKVHAIGIDSIASKSRVPPNLKDFMARVGGVAI